MLSPSKLHAIKQIQTNVRQPELYLTVSAFILLKCYFINYTYLCGMCPSLHKVRSFLQSQQGARRAARPDYGGCEDGSSYSSGRVPHEILMQNLGNKLRRRKVSVKEPEILNSAFTLLDTSLDRY